MEIFISWSGEKSRQVALLLDEWIKMVIQAARPWLSTSIDSGALWFSELNEQLASVSMGIICLTAENKEKPWILFEAGALAKGLQKSRVCTFLIDLKNEDIGQPLAQFNHTEASREGIYQLIKTVNNHLDANALPLEILNKVFNKNWPEFEERFSQIKKTNSEDAGQKRSTDNILSELLQSVRGFDKKMERTLSLTYVRSQNKPQYGNDYKNEVLIQLSELLESKEIDSSQLRGFYLNHFSDYSPNKLDKLVRTARNLIEAKKVPDPGDAINAILRGH